MRTAPDPIVPVPATTVHTLRGQRVIIGVPGVGFRDDLRSDDAVVRGGRTFIPVLTELDYYRAETQQIETFAMLVPIDRVWVETAIPGRSTVPIASLDAPPPRVPVPASSASRATGLRVVHSVPDGFVRDLRAVSEIHLNLIGEVCLRVCIEADWYLWAMDGTTPSTMEVSAGDSWIE